MAHDLIPEVHDILKLCQAFAFEGQTRRRSPHSNVLSVHNEVVSKGYKLQSKPSWEGVVKHHHGKNFKLFPDTPDLFLLDMADSLAAAISRGDNRLRLGHPQPFKKYGFDDKLFRLWKNQGKDRQRGRQYRPFQLEKVLEFLEKDPDVNEFYKFIGDSMFERAEDATIGANLTSLFIHSELTGKFYRLLKQAEYGVNPADLSKGRKGLVTLYKSKMDDWSLAVTRFKIRFPQKPIRTKDMNVFSKLSETRASIEAQFKDRVFFNTSDEMLMILPPDMSTQTLSRFLNYGFWIEYVEQKQILNKLNPKPVIGNGDVKEGIVAPPHPVIINPPICEICQMEKGEKKWIKDYILMMDLCDRCKEIVSVNAWPPDVKELCEKDIPGLAIWLDERIDEDICKHCFDIRIENKDTRLKKLARWSEEKIGIDDEDILTGINPRVIWIKINLDFAELIRSLELLYGKYLKEIGVQNESGAVEIRFSVLTEYRRDYDKFLTEFEKALRKHFCDDMEVPILEDLFVIKIAVLGQIIGVLNIYNDLFAAYFPRFKDLNSSPLKLSISCSRSKFPFFEHWELLRKPASDIHITLINKGEVITNVKSLDEILIRAGHAKDKSNIRALHKLAEIAKLSETLASIALQDKSNKDYNRYREILPMGMGFNSLLTLTKILEDQNEVY